MSLPIDVVPRPEPTREPRPQEWARGVEQSWFRSAHRAAARNPSAPPDPPAPLFGDTLADAWFR